MARGRPGGHPDIIELGRATRFQAGNRAACGRCLRKSQMSREEQTDAAAIRALNWCLDIIVNPLNELHDRWTVRLAIELLRRCLPARRELAVGSDQKAFPETIDLARILADIAGEQDGLEAEGPDESVSPPVRNTG